MEGADAEAKNGNQQCFSEKLLRDQVWWAGDYCKELCADAGGTQ